LAILDWDDACRGPAAADALWHAITFPLATGRPERSIFRLALKELTPFYSVVDLSRAAHFWLHRWTNTDSTEIIPGVNKTPKLIQFEERRERILEKFAAL
jgi:hypothetical protein